MNETSDWLHGDIVHLLPDKKTLYRVVSIYPKWFDNEIDRITLVKFKSALITFHAAKPHQLIHVEPELLI